MENISSKSFQVLVLSLLFFLSSIHGVGRDFITANSALEKSIKSSSIVPTVDFTFNNPGSCSGTTIIFNPSITGDGPFTYLWDFGDGSSASGSNPSHSYIALGCGFQNFTVILKVTDRNGSSSTISKVLSVQQKPDLKFVNLNAAATSTFERCGDNNSDLKYTVNVGNSSTSTSCITSYNVDWGDGSSETNVSFPKQHTYLKLGSFNMVITGVGSSGCNNTITYVVKNSNNPIGSLIAPGNTTNFCVPVDPINFAIGTWASNPSDTRYLVNFGDGTTASYSQSQLESSVYYNASNPVASQNFPVPHTFTRFNCPSGNIVSLTISTSCGSTFLTAGPIIILDKPTVSFSVNSIVCANTSVYFNNTTIAGFTNDCSTVDVYTWDFGDGSAVSRQVNPSHVYTSPGKYTITLNAVTPCGIGQTYTRTICVEPILQPNFTYVKACAGTNTQLVNTTDTSLSCGPQGFYWEIINYFDNYCGKSPYQWSFTNGKNAFSKDPVINFITAGTYYLRLRTSNSCGIENFITKVIEVKKPPVTTLDPISDFCNSATINPVGRVIESCAPTAELTFLWSFPGGSPSSSNLLNPGPINYSSSGSYTATFSVSNSCGTTTKTAGFSVNTVLSPIITPKTVEICSGASFNVVPVTGTGNNVPAGTTYTWSAPAVSPVGAVSGASAQLNPQTRISQLLTNLTSNIAMVTYTVSPISGSCAGPNFTVTVTVDPLINVNSIIKNSSCFGSNDGKIDLTVIGGIPFSIGSPYRFSWTGPNGFTSTAEDLSNLVPGNYNLQVIDNGNCPFAVTFLVKEPGNFSFSGVKTDISCYNKNDGRIELAVTGGNLPYIYSWTKNGSPFSIAGSLTNLTEGVYNVSITEANNCAILVETYTIINPPVLDVSLGRQKNILCYGDFSGEIDINVVGGRSVELLPTVFNYTYSWSGPNGFMSPSKNLRNVAAGTYRLVVTDNSGCTDDLEVVLTQNIEIKLQATTTEIACYNYANASITITNISGGIPFVTGEPYLIKWSNLGSGRVQKDLSAGTYIITIIDAVGCEKQFPIVIDNAPIFTINPDVKQISCYGDRNAYIKLNLVGGKAPVSLVWSDSTTAGTERNNLGPGTYRVTITDGKSCQIAENFIITEPLPLELKATVSNILDCDNANTGVISLVVTGGVLPYGYTWSNGAKTKDLVNLPPDNYTVIVTDANGCKATKAFTITRFEQLTPTVETITDYNCDTKYVKQTFVGQVKGGAPPYTLSWSDGVVTGYNGQIMNTLNNGLIIFSVTDNFGCKANYSFNVNTPVLGIANFSFSSYGKNLFDLYSIFDPIQFTNLATGDFTNVSWDFGDGNFSDEKNPAHVYSKVGLYTVKQTVTYPFGCQYVYSSTIKVEKGYSLVMPTAFSPNGDGINDSFSPVFLGLIEMTLHVYDTWGSLVYSETGETIKGWNGQLKGLGAENGNYYFKLIGTTFYKHTITERGAFTIIK